MGRSGVNELLWALALALQCALVALVFARGVARRMPVFAMLLVFYPLRSAALFAVYGRIGAGGYVTTYNGLSLVDLLLQMAVAVEIAVQLVRAAGGWTLQRMGLLAMLPGLVWAAVWMTMLGLPANAPVPPDRLQMFDSLLMVLLCGWALARPAPAMLRRVTMGLAFYGFFELVTIAVRTYAATERDARMFAEWSYILPGAWVMVVLYWIATLRVGRVTAAAPVG